MLLLPPHSGRGKLHREKSPLLKFKTALLDTPYFGIPGIVNFIDVRTQWFDAAVKRAIADGLTQVGPELTGFRVLGGRGDKAI